MALLVKRDGTAGGSKVLYRDFWGIRKREELVESLAAVDFDAAYIRAQPIASNRFIMRKSDIAADYASWPRLSEMASQNPIPGLQEMRQEALIDRDRGALAKRMKRYFDVEEALSVLQCETAAQFSTWRDLTPLKLAITY